jgi:hypothetical protein
MVAVQVAAQQVCLPEPFSFFFFPLRTIGYEVGRALKRYEQVGATGLLRG